MKILQSAIDKIGRLLGRPKTYMKFLNEKEFDSLLRLMRDWYSYGIPLDKIMKKKDPAFISMMNKIKAKATEKLPNKLYRGIAFQTKADHDKAIKSLENGKFPTNPHEKQTYGGWSTSKKVAGDFLPNGEYGKSRNDKYGILFEINPRDFKEDIVFSMHPLLKTREDITIFLRLVLEKQQENANKILDKKPFRKEELRYSFDPVHGAIHSTVEKEYILKNPTKNIDKIKHTEEKKD